MTETPIVQLADQTDTATALIAALVRDETASRLFAQDATLWGAAAEAEAKSRLGWIDAAERAGDLVSEIISLRAQLVEKGVTRIVLCGMGGSSLAPEVIAAQNRVELTILDSTHPVTVDRVLSGNLTHTAVVVSSKSGSTIDTMSHLAAFEKLFSDANIEVSSRIIVVTDPGSPLEEHAEKRGYRVFFADPTVGGRFSALTAFGLVPAGLAGSDIETLIKEARDVAAVLTQDNEQNPALSLAAALMSGFPAQYACALTEVGFKVGLGDWIEQLIAESTGKQGLGILPLVVHASAPELSGRLPDVASLIALTTSPEAVGAPHFVADATVTAPLGAQFLLWEVATALVCRLLKVNPFDQPDVESAKVAARAALDEEALSPSTSKRSGSQSPASIHEAESVSINQILEYPAVHGATLPEAVQQLRAALSSNGYLSLQIYADRQGNMDRWEQLREDFAQHWPAPVTLGWGPRFLHSTGQLHKGGQPVGVYLQVIEQTAIDVPIPRTDLGFGRLMTAQARGDRNVLMERGRPVLAISTSNLPKLCEALENALHHE